MTRTPLALRFLSGPFQGRAVPVDSRRPLLIGRQPGADILLSEERVSRRHASVGYEGDALVLRDLSSTNGTFVNGVRVARALLEEGDRVIVGASILRVARSERPPAAVATAGQEGGAVTAIVNVATAMQGRLEEVPLPHLLQLLGNSRKSGVLLVRREGHVAEILLHAGDVAGCVVDGREGHSVAKGFNRLLCWTEGEFELRPEPVPAPASPVPLEMLLMEGMRQKDELRRARAALPDRLVPAGTPPVDLEPQDGALLALVARNAFTDAVLDATPLSDLAAAERLAALLGRGLLVAQPDASSSRPLLRSAGPASNRPLP